MGVASVSRHHWPFIDQNLLIQEKNCHQLVQLFRLLVRFNHSAGLMKGKTDQLIRLTQQIRIANATGHVETHIVIFGHANHVVDVSEEIL